MWKLVSAFAHDLYHVPPPPSLMGRTPVSCAAAWQMDASLARAGTYAHVLTHAHGPWHPPTPAELRTVYPPPPVPYESGGRQLGRHFTNGYVIAIMIYTL